MGDAERNYKDWSYKLISTIGVLFHILLIDLPLDFYKWITLKPKDVKGQVVVVTGGGSGLGQRLSELLAQKGAKLALIDVNQDGLNQTCKLIRDAGGTAEAWKCDITNENELNATAKKIDDRFGKVDIVVCNAAVLSFGLFLDLTADQLRKAVDVNITGTILTIRAFLEQMENRNSGQIVAISSIAGYAGESYGLAYCPSKYAVRGVMECLQNEMRDRGLHGIKCTTVCPYFARTPMILGYGMRPTSTWIPFMSINTCSRKIMRAMLQEETLAFIPSIMTLIPIFKSVLSTRAYRSLRDYLGCRYQPANSTSTRKLLPIMPDVFRQPPAFWWAIIPPALLINFLAWYSPSSLDTWLLPVVGPLSAHIGRNYHWITTLTNAFALVAHVGEGIYAMVLCDKLRYSFACSAKWFAQTFILGFPSLTLLIKQAKKAGAA